jgi:hypothetical protein
MAPTNRRAHGRVNRLGEFSRVNFRPMGGCLLWTVSKNFIKIAENFGVLFIKVKMMYLFSQKNGLGYMLGDFLQAHLVTLAHSVAKNVVCE